MANVESLIKSLSHLRGVRVVAAMSGGVDSSVMAALLKDAGADVIGVFLHVWDYSREEVAGHGSCCSLDDAYDARRVSDQIGIPFYSMDMRDNFRDNVIDPFIADYESGRTPNPCERCNRFVKFGALLDAADELEAAYVATGHYVQRHDDESGVRIFRGADDHKDQSYFLATISRRQASRILFPVGNLQKDETRELARHYNLLTAEKHESQDICFIPAGDRIAFLKREGASAGFVPGDIIDTEGNRLGSHQGIAHYTLGQRKGLNLSDGPWHVVALDGVTARVVVAHPAEAMIRRVEVGEAEWIRQPVDGEKLIAKVRYQMKPAACSLTMQGDDYELVFDTPQKPSAPGQVAAVYAGQELLGGGIVQAVHRDGQTNV
ncbi:MAG: tRNA 2-thiouridine(34) synthase MnmA [Zetaproteobacteria bacterium CG12_big_fil_rev_8_21_14_0_65_55_1124]|nr:MAG: tRNA 2-thiouridine(34) synthase MnmA [Zetaproteobacteria bacterium CG1_02_55_237]PIS19600.1 MAG: tRNA 2-thiouridine(34) synthase MnmA [Zetaproteobacteria bacterium CG08_land_8_20_14_0_20_55_17]PIW42639.1 MAG: tRNA 2-thiouridine(34) synthase MnmA [Zetaproteobacteria bacterium CG12_big_fil_rev_8_21_14_0_65_55_1124]PIY52004.1 MAG: tRNA 2-thiouridine(34) synthase MnmA [Zetaproteobacteria bacterium CG_4_10_14_0_8_um_filter_55_43]PIZ38931.1 MAG: tRNA 2-thiouridine(34) synthase MnmA [Zetaprote